MLLILLASALALGGCGLFLPETGPFAIPVRANTFTLSWDSDRSSLIDLPSSVDHHRVYYRPYGRVEWRLVRVTSDATRTVTITPRDLEYGRYEFAVQEVYRDGKSSDVHRSSDFSAWPVGGWYVDWQSP